MREKRDEREGERERERVEKGVDRMGVGEKQRE
jgi:hypothetical protein